MHKARTREIPRVTNQLTTGDSRYANTTATAKGHSTGDSSWIRNPNPQKTTPIRANRMGAPTPQWILALPFAGPYLDELWTKYIGSPGSMGEVIQAVSGANIGNIYRAVLAAGGASFHLLLTLLFMLIATLFTQYRLRR